MQRIALVLACLACACSPAAARRLRGKPLKAGGGKPLKAGVKSLSSLLVAFKAPPAFNPAALAAGTSGRDVSSSRSRCRPCTAVMNDLPKGPTTRQDLDLLSLALEFAVRTEDYEKAARLKEQLDALEQADLGLAFKWHQQKQVLTMLEQALFSGDSIEARKEAIQALQKKATSNAAAEDALHKILREVDGTDADQISEIVAAALSDFWLQSEDSKADDLMTMGMHCMEERLWKEAEDIFTKVIKRMPDFAEAWNKRATVYFAMKDFKKARADYNKVLEIKPRHFGCLSGLAMCQFSLRPPDAEAGLRCCEQALDVHPRLSNLKLMVEKLKMTPS